MVRRTGNDPELVELATRNALAIAAGHCFVIFLRDGFPVNILNPVKADDGQPVARKTVATSLRRQGLAGISPRTFAPATTVVDLDAAVPKDLVGRRFDTGRLDRVWTSDITYLRAKQGWLYL